MFKQEVKDVSHQKMVELTQKSIPDTVCNSEPYTDPLYPYLYCRCWKWKVTFWDFVDSWVLVCFIQWKDSELNENIREGRRLSDSGSEFSSFNTSGPATLVQLPPAPMQYMFLEHQGLEAVGFLVTEGSGFRSSYCSYYP